MIIDAGTDPEQPSDSTSSQDSVTTLDKNSSVVSSCRICLSTLVDPAALSCGHRFCEGCLNKYWHTRDKPHFIVCPLCRDYAFDINFVRKSKVESTKEFRKTFHWVDVDNMENSNGASAIIMCLKLSFIVPTIYYILKFLRSPFLSFLAYLQWKI